MQTSLKTLGEILEALPTLTAEHARTTAIYKALSEGARTAVASSNFNQRSGFAVSLGNFGSVIFPFSRMGAISTLDLFGLDELIIFAFYWANRHRYLRVADIGANLGLHSILMARCGWHVVAYEPDPQHVSSFRRNLDTNGITTVEVIEAAVSDEVGLMPFIRVLGNTTSSHLAGAKSNPYGELEKFDVRVVDIQEIVKGVDLLKIDVEGHEAVLLRAIPDSLWSGLDAIVEIGTPQNARSVFDRFRDTGIHIYAQKIGWAVVRRLADMPISYKEGGVFISAKSSMPWD